MSFPAWPLEEKKEEKMKKQEEESGEGSSFSPSS
jgi:hypothetical protein